MDSKYLKAYLDFNIGNECPINYHIWAGLCAASAVVSRRVYIPFGSSRIYLNLYVLLIGDQGSRKTTAKDIARDLLEDHFPSIPRSAAVTSKEQLMDDLADEEVTMRVYKDEEGVSKECHPIMLFVNELKNFLANNPRGMLEFLTDIYDRRFFDYRYRRGTGVIPEPYVVLCACETDKWITDNLKGDIIDGGFARRIIPIFETKLRDRVAFPFTGPAAKQEVIDMLKKAESLVGPLQWDEDTKKEYESWYHNMKIPEEPYMKGWYSSKHVQLLKVMGLLTITDYGDLRMRLCTFHEALALLDSVEPNMHDLYRGTGRNPLAGPTNRLMNTLLVQGFMSEKRFRIMAAQEMSPYEVDQSIKHLLKTEQLVRHKHSVNGVVRDVLFTKEALAKLLSRTPQSEG